jgi:hypothetical protein
MYCNIYFIAMIVQASAFGSQVACRKLPEVVWFSRISVTLQHRTLRWNSAMVEKLSGCARRV